MSWPYDQLGLPGGADADADERTIKRAYARQLKTMRPDEDPEGFQRLHAAYREALERCDRRTQQTPADAQPAVRAEPLADPDDADASLRAAADAPLAPRESLRPLDPRASQRPHAPSHEIAQDWSPPPAGPTRVSDLGPIPPPDILPHRHSEPPPSPFAPPAPAAATADPWELRALAAQVVSMAAASHPEALVDWLQAQPALWSLGDKALVADALLEALHRDPPPLAVAQFDALAEFFGLFDLRSGHAPEAVFALRDRLALAHALAGGDLRGVAERLHQDGSSQAAHLREVRRLLQQLRRPWSWPQALAMALVPGLPTRLHRFVQVLRGMGGDALPAGLDPRQVAYWEAVGDRDGWSWPRATVLALRLGLYPLALPLLSWLLELGALPAEVAGRRYLALFAALGLGWAWLRLSLGFAEWQTAQDPAERPWLGRLRSGAVPALLGLGLVLHFLPGTEPLSWLLLPTLVIGILARLVGGESTLNALVLLLRRGWVWVLVPIAIALFGAYSGSGILRGLIYIVMVVFAFGMWRGTRTRP